MRIEQNIRNKNSVSACSIQAKGQDLESTSSQRHAAVDEESKQVLINYTTNYNNNFEKTMGLGTAPCSQRETDQHLFGPGEAMDPESLDADFAKLQETFEEQEDVERSQLYETGDASDAIRSVSRACASVVSAEKSQPNVAHESSSTEVAFPEQHQP